jgi:hypothetical protein
LNIDTRIGLLYISLVNTVANINPINLAIKSNIPVEFFEKYEAKFGAERKPGEKVIAVPLKACIREVYSTIPVFSCG